MGFGVKEIDGIKVAVGLWVAVAVGCWMIVADGLWVGGIWVGPPGHPWL